LEAIAQDHLADSRSWKGVVQESFLNLPDDTIETVSHLPSGNKRDHSLAAIAGIFVNSSRPIEALEWTLGVGDSEIARKSFDSLINKISMDLKISRNRHLIDQMRALVSEDENLSPVQKNRWIERIEVELQSR